MTERRPIATRNTRVAGRVAAALARAGVSPNLISQASILFAALAGLCFWQSGGDRPVWLILAALSVQARLLCNLFDGMVAVEGGRAGPDGPFWNEAPDRYADIAIMVGMGAGAGVAWLGWAASAMAVLAAYQREAGAAQGMTADFSGPMAKPHRMAVATGAALLCAIWPRIGGWSVLELALWLIAIGALATALRRAVRVVRFLKRR